MTGRAHGLDTQPHPVFATYSAGNFAEVAPQRLSVMSWSLLGDPVERGVRSLTRRIWPAATWQTGSHYAFVGYFNCRPYHNLAAFCHMARELPGLAEGEVTASYFENTSIPALPPGLRSSPARRASSLPRLLRELVSLRPRVSELEGLVTELEGQLRAAMHGSRATALGICTARAQETLDLAWALHYSITLTLVPLRALHAAVGRRVVDRWEQVEPLTGRPTDLVWSMLGDLRSIEWPGGPAAFLDRAFYELADDHAPWCEYALGRQVVDGAATPQRAGAVPAQALWSIETRARAALLPQLSRLVGDTMACREGSKSLAMRCMHVFRQLIPRLAHDAGVAEDAWPYLTISELTDVHAVADLDALAQRRRELCTQALLCDAPERLQFDGEGTRRPAASQTPPSARGVSPGRVTGVVVDQTLAAVESDAPKILVCASADAEVQSILPLVDGVLTERGSALSHIAILVREYGIPAVVGHPLARGLVPGQWITLDGSRGEVKIVGDDKDDPSKRGRARLSHSSRRRSHAASG